MKNNVKRLQACQNGVAAVEFALILPLLLFLVLGVVEVTRFVLAVEKMNNAAAQIANAATNSPTTYNLTSYYANLETNALPELTSGYTSRDQLGVSVYDVNPDTGFPKTAPSFEYGGGAAPNKIINSFPLQLGETLVAVTVRSQYNTLLPDLTIPTIGKILDISPDQTFTNTAYYRVRQAVVPCETLRRSDSDITCEPPSLPKMPPPPPCCEGGGGETPPPPSGPTGPVDSYVPGNPPSIPPAG